MIPAEASSANAIHCKPLGPNDYIYVVVQEAVWKVWQNGSVRMTFWFSCGDRRSWRSALSVARSGMADVRTDPFCQTFPDGFLHDDVRCNRCGPSGFAMDRVAELASAESLPARGVVVSPFVGTEYSPFRRAARR